MSVTPKMDRQGGGARYIGLPRRPVGTLDDIGSARFGPVERWLCRRSPDCRREQCTQARRWARLSRMRQQYARKRT